MTNHDDTTAIQELKNDVRLFAEQRDWGQFHTPKNLAIGMATEASELLELYRFKSEDEIQDLMNDEAKRQEMKDEVADVLWFVLRFAQMYDIDLASAFKTKLEKNRDKYPVEAAKGSNKKYTELDH